MKIIEIVVSIKGETKIETKGFHGTECRDATRSLESALGLRESESLTSEFFQPLNQRLDQQVRD